MLRGKQKHPLLPFLALALLLHLGAVPLAPPLVSMSPSSPTKKRIRVITLTHSASAKRPKARSKKKVSRLKKAQKFKKKKKPAKKEHDRDWARKKQVFVPPSLDQSAPEDSRFVSEFNSKADRETISRNARFQPENVLNERSVVQRSERPATDLVNRGASLSLGASGAPSQVPSRPQALEIPNVRLRDRLALRFDPKAGILKNKVGQGRLLGNSFRLRVPRPDQQADPGASTTGKQSPLTGAGERLNLVPDVGVLARLSGGPDLQLLDQGLEEGEGTFLNSSSFKYGGFFRRVRSRIGSFWNPVRELHRRDPTGNVFGRRDRITVVTLTLDSIGNVQDAFVAQTSGLDFLDQAAVGALRRARQFPNLPQDLLSSNDTFTFSFRFHVVRNGHGGRRGRGRSF